MANENDISRAEVIELMRLLTERLTAVNVGVQALRLLLQDRGGFSPEEYAAAYERVRAEWDRQVGALQGPDSSSAAALRRLLGRFDGERQ